MKNLILVLISATFLFACSGKEETQTQQNFPPCTINGHDCWEVVQLLEKTKIISPTKEEREKYKKEHNLPWLSATDRAQLIHYENRELESLNLSVIKASAAFDGGSEKFVLSTGATIFRAWNTGIERKEPVGYFRNIIAFPTGEVFILNNKGTIIEYTQPLPSQED